MTNRADRGRDGEDRARRYLELHGYRFIEANWRCSAGELDLVMRDGDELVFVEVKTRRGDGAGRAEESIAPAKVRRLLTAAEWYLAEHPEVEGLIWRIDLVAITLPAGDAAPRLTHLKNAVLSG